MIKATLLALSMLLPLAAQPSLATERAHAVSQQTALNRLVYTFGHNLGPTAMYGDRLPLPSCKIYVNFLDDGTTSPTPGVRISIEKIDLLLVVVDRADFIGYIGGATPLTAAAVTTAGTTILQNAWGHTLSVGTSEHGKPLVKIDGRLSCEAAGRIFF